MAIDGIDGTYGVDYWSAPDADGETDPDETEYSEDEGELKARIAVVLAAGRFTFAILFKARPDDEWDELETFRAGEEP